MMIPTGISPSPYSPISFLLHHHPSPSATPGTMLTLTPGCACEVCAEEYGPNRLPHSITCGHVLCATCCQTIIEKTSPRLSPVCPFCRVTFSGDSMRLIRTDFATSGWNTPRRVPALETLTDINSDMLQRKTAHLFNSADGSRSSTQVRRLEDKVSRIAAKKCSVEEVSMLYKELESWLLQEKDDQTSSLFLSAALLRAILMNHLAHSEASKAAKTIEANMRGKIEDLDNELRRHRSQLHQKTQECNSLRTEVNQLRALASTIGSAAEQQATTAAASHTTPTLSPSAYTSHSYSHSSATSPPTSHSTSPTPYSSASHYASGSSSASAAAAAAASPLSRFNSVHGRSASMSARPMTPASISLSHSQQPVSPTRSHTPAPPRSHTPGPSPARSHTPAPRSHTPAAGVSSASAAAAQAARSHTPSLMRSHTPAGAPPPMPAFSTRYSSTPTPSPYHTSTTPTATSHPPHQHTGPPMSASTGMGGYGLGLRAQTPAPAALVPPKPRRLSLSTPSPPKMMSRSTSDEKAEAHQRWLPPTYGGRGVVDDSGAGEYGMKGHTRSGSRAGFRV